MKFFILVFSFFSLSAFAATNEIERTKQFEHTKHGLIKEVVIKNPRVIDHKIWSESDRDGICKAIAAQIEIDDFKLITSKELGHSEYWMTYTHALSPKDYVEVDANGLVKNTISSSERHVKRLNCYFKQI